MTCFDDNVLALLASSHRITPAEREDIDRHLDRCAACAGVVTELARTVTPAARSLRYELVAQLGAGAMGEVWEAHDRALDRRVALKLLRGDLIDGGGTPAGSAAEWRRGFIDDVERRARFLREARALARVRHDHVVAVHDLGALDDGQLFIAMQLVAGHNARAWQRAATRTPAEVYHVWRCALDGLAAVHAAGIVHRDVKPENVLVTADGSGLIADFGLARDHEADAQRLTATGLVVGTPRYLAPECLLGGPASAAADQFAFCVCMWEALTGERPFDGATPEALAHGPCTPPRIPSGDRRGVLEALARGLARDPDRRWPDLAGLARALDEAVAAEHVEPRRLAARLPLVVLAALAAGAISTPRSSAHPIAATAPPIAVRAPAIASSPVTPVRVATTAPRAVEPIASAPATRAVHHVDAWSPVVPTESFEARYAARLDRRDADATATRQWTAALAEADAAFASGDAGRCARLLAPIAHRSGPGLQRAWAVEEHLRALCSIALGDCRHAVAEWRAYLHDEDPYGVTERAMPLDTATCELSGGGRSATARTGA